MVDIFISYRREDARADAGRIYDRLSARFSGDHVFMDIEDIEPGENFVRVLEQTLSSCDVLIVLIGKRWIDAGGGTSRLADPGDFVRLEIEKALSREIRIIPLLVGKAQMPRASDLPDTLSDLSNRQAFEINDSRFHQDIDQLIAVLDNLESARVGTRDTALRHQPAELSSAKVKAMLARQQFYDARWNAAGQATLNGYETRVIGDDVVVLDGATSLMWQKGGSGERMLHERAEAYVQGLNEKVFAGFDDWRMPTLEEAMSLMEPAPRAGAYIDPVFEFGAAPIMWTADRAPEDRLWVVYFFDGCCDVEKPNFNAWVRVVRRAD